jgi:hypothetical protein
LAAIASQLSMPHGDRICIDLKTVGQPRKTQSVISFVNKQKPLKALKVETGMVWHL